MDGKRELRKVESKVGDTEYSIDRDSDKLFFGNVDRGGFDWYIITEHTTYGNPKSPFIVVADNFDGSKIFEQDIPQMWYSVWTLYSREKDLYKPVFTSSLDIRNQILAITREESNVELNLRDDTESGKGF